MPYFLLLQLSMDLIGNTNHPLFLRARRVDRKSQLYAMGSAEKSRNVELEEIRHIHAESSLARRTFVTEPQTVTEGLET